MIVLFTFQDWFTETFGNITMETVRNWVVYNPKEPLLFNTGLFLGLFIVFYVFYISLKNTFYQRLVYVIAFSLFFYYKSSGIYFLLLVASSVVDYNLGNLVHRTTSVFYKNLCLAFSIIINLGFLGYFKYTNFVIDTYNSVSGTHFAFQKIILPVGISFYTFQSISYIIEVYRKEIEPTKHYVDYLFFNTLIIIMITIISYFFLIFKPDSLKLLKDFSKSLMFFNKSLTYVSLIVGCKSGEII